MKASTYSSFDELENGSYQQQPRSFDLPSPTSASMASTTTTSVIAPTWREYFTFFLMGFSAFLKVCLFLGALVCIGFAVGILKNDEPLTDNDRRESAWMLVEGTLLVIGWIFEGFLLLVVQNKAKWRDPVNYIFRPVYFLIFIASTFAGIYQLGQSRENASFIFMVIWMSTCLFLNVVAVLLFFKLKFSGQYILMCTT